MWGEEAGAAWALIREGQILRNLPHLRFCLKSYCFHGNPLEINPFVLTESSYAFFEA